jgi:hypothetical protein
MSQFVAGPQMPGLPTARTATPRQVTIGGEKFLPGGMIVDGANGRDPANTTYPYELRAGVLMGRITASNKLGVSIFGVMGVLHDTSVVTTTMTLPAATVAEIQRRCGASSGTFRITGPATAAGTVNSEIVAYSAVPTTTTLTITATTNDFIAGSFIGADDGSYLPITCIPNGYPLRVVNYDQVDIDVPLERVLVEAEVIGSQFLPYWPTDASLITWIKTQLNAVGNGHWIFRDNFIGS